MQVLEELTVAVTARMEVEVVGPQDGNGWTRWVVYPAETEGRALGSLGAVVKYHAVDTYQVRLATMDHGYMEVDDHSMPTDLTQAVREVVNHWARRRLQVRS